jgi:tripartite-type tricarboxylate transporter receptor subunit TctC
VTRIVVPFAAGGAREVLARTFYAELGAALGQTIIVENRPARRRDRHGERGEGAPGRHHARLRRVEPQRHRAALGRPAYDPIKDFAAVANVGMQSYVLMTSATVPARSIGELDRAREGKSRQAELFVARDTAARDTWRWPTSRGWPASTWCTSRSSRPRMRPTTCWPDARMR